MNHKHHHCQHPALKFCEHCNVVYCVDCGKEWFETQYTITTHPQPVAWWYFNSNGALTPTPPADDLTPKFTCSHHDGGQHAE